MHASIARPYCTIILLNLSHQILHFLLNYEKEFFVCRFSPLMDMDHHLTAQPSPRLLLGAISAPGDLAMPLTHCPGHLDFPSL